MKYNQLVYVMKYINFLMQREVYYLQPYSCKHIYNSGAVAESFMHNKYV